MNIDQNVPLSHISKVPLSNISHNEFEINVSIYTTNLMVVDWHPNNDDLMCTGFCHIKIIVSTLMFYTLQQIKPNPTTA